MNNSSLNNISLWDIMPDYTKAVSISGRNSYTASYPCWLLGWSVAASSTPQVIFVNGVVIAREEYDLANIQIPLDVGDVVTTSTGTFSGLTTCAMKGAV